jgi:hypothetical protein
MDADQGEEEGGWLSRIKVRVCWSKTRWRQCFLDGDKVEFYYHGAMMQNMTTGNYSHNQPIVAISIILGEFV